MAPTKSFEAGEPAFKESCSWGGGLYMLSCTVLVCLVAVSYHSMQLQVCSSSNGIDDKLDVLEEAANEEADADDGANDAAADEEVQHPMSLEEETAVVQTS